MPVVKEDVSCIRDGRMLSGFVVEAVMEAALSGAKQEMGIFMPKLGFHVFAERDVGAALTSGCGKFRRQRRIEKKMRAANQILIPITSTIGVPHFFLFVVDKLFDDCTRVTFRVYDSLGGRIARPHRHYASIILGWLCFSFPRSFSLKVTELELVFQEETPRQGSTLDCGLFMGGVAAHIRLGGKISQSTFSLKDTTALRADLAHLWQKTSDGEPIDVLSEAVVRSVKKHLHIPSSTLEVEQLVNPRAPLPPGGANTIVRKTAPSADPDVCQERTGNNGTTRSANPSRSTQKIPESIFVTVESSHVESSQVESSQVGDEAPRSRYHRGSPRKSELAVGANHKKLSGLKAWGKPKLIRQNVTAMGATSSKDDVRDIFNAGGDGGVGEVALKGDDTLTEESSSGSLEFTNALAVHKGNPAGALKSKESKSKCATTGEDSVDDDETEDDLAAVAIDDTAWDGVNETCRVDSSNVGEDAVVTNESKEFDESEVDEPHIVAHDGADEHDANDAELAMVHTAEEEDGGDDTGDGSAGVGVADTPSIDEGLYEYLYGVGAERKKPEEVIFTDMMEAKEFLFGYEKVGGFSFRTIKSRRGKHAVCDCGTHVDCPLLCRVCKLKPGKPEFIIRVVDGRHTTTLKPTADGRKRKTRRAYVATAASLAQDTKINTMVPGDVMKTSHHFMGLQDKVPYREAHRAVERRVGRTRKEEVLSFQKIIPYLEGLSQANQSSHIAWSMGENQEFDRCFISFRPCNRALKYVRPVINLDAAHLKSRFGGCLFAATVLSADNSIYPIAFALVSGNEGAEPWNWFCTHLDSACPNIKRCWDSIFISDREKGLWGALRTVFPGRLQVKCAFHVRKNVETSQRFGKAVGEKIPLLAATFSYKRWEELWEQIVAIIGPRRTQQLREYLDELPKYSWRTLDWVDSIQQAMYDEAGTDDVDDDSSEDDVVDDDRIIPPIAGDLSASGDDDDIPVGGEDSRADDEIGDDGPDKEMNDDDTVDEMADEVAQTEDAAAGDGNTEAIGGGNNGDAYAQLPPRYGMITSNTAESFNNLFLPERDMPWLHCIQGIVDKMATRTCEQRQRYEGRDGSALCERARARLEKAWELSNRYDVYELVKGKRYLVRYPGPTRTMNIEDGSRHILRVQGPCRYCTCGEWQEHRIPCRHAAAYYRQVEEVNTIDDLAATDAIWAYHRLQACQQLYRTGVTPVPDGNIEADGTTKPPVVVTKSGRPRKKRLRKKEELLSEEQRKRQKRCSRCRGIGHNARGCTAAILNPDNL